MGHSRRLKGNLSEKQTRGLCLLCLCPKLIQWLYYLFVIFFPLQMIWWTSLTVGDCFKRLRRSKCKFTIKCLLAKLHPKITNVQMPYCLYLSLEHQFYLISKTTLLYQPCLKWANAILTAGSEWGFWHKCRLMSCLNWFNYL